MEVPGPLELVESVRDRPLAVDPQAVCPEAAGDRRTPKRQRPETNRRLRGREDGASA